MQDEDRNQNAIYYEEQRNYQDSSNIKNTNSQDLNIQNNDLNNVKSNEINGYNGQFLP